MAQGTPEIVRDLERRWSLTVGAASAGDGSCSWVAPVTLSDGTPAVLKVGMPHFEGEHEIQGLRFWNGDPTVRLLNGDEELGAMLLERCHPGTPLRSVSEQEQDVVIASLLRRLWRVPPKPHCFRPLSQMLDFWTEETLVGVERCADPGLAREGLRLYRELAASAPAEVLLATDLHAGNVLRAEREEWLVIDPKPFVGDPAYDATQHLLNCPGRLLRDPLGTVRRFTDLLGLDDERVRLWTFARIATGQRSLTVAAQLR